MKTIEKYERKIHERVWGQEIFVAETEHYLGKMLVMKALAFERSVVSIRV